MDSSMSPADLAALSNDGFGGNNWFAMIILFALIFGWGGNGWGGNGFANAIGYENLATGAEMQRGFDNQNSMANQRDILAAVNAAATQGVQAGTQNTQYLSERLSDKYGELQRDIAGLGVGQANLLAAQNGCCSSLQMLVSGTAAQQRYDSAMQTAQLEQAIHEEGSATRAMLQQDKIEGLQQQVSALQLQQAVAGVVRYPDSFSYNAGTNPFCNCGPVGCCNV